ncbi:MAG: DUF368 domain-containing protein [Oscillospiraceae bacterium]|nr:DUF368 domain-containing protein [Oscillospiraceae bacterium]
MKQLIDFLKGAIIGVAILVPGASAGTIALSVGIYERLVNSIGNLFKNLKENMIFLIPVGLGGVVGLFAISRIMEHLLDNFMMPTMFVFIGLILGGIPLVFKRANEKGFEKKYLIPAGITLAIGLGFAIVELLGLTGYAITQMDISVVNILLLFVFGVVAATSLVIPGFSGSFMLILLGAYAFLLSSVNSLDIPILIPFVFGVRNWNAGLCKIC